MRMLFFAFSKKSRVLDACACEVGAARSAVLGARPRGVGAARARGENGPRAV
jgi:hypothetical protein